MSIFFHLSDIHNTSGYTLIFDIYILETGFEIFLLEEQFIFFLRGVRCLGNFDNDIQGHNMNLFTGTHSKVSDILLFYKNSNSIH